MYIICPKDGASVFVFDAQNSKHDRFISLSDIFFDHCSRIIFYDFFEKRNLHMMGSLDKNNVA